MTIPAVLFCTSVDEDLYELNHLQASNPFGEYEYKAKCSYCGQYGKTKTVCEYCGEPIDE